MENPQNNKKIILVGLGAIAIIIGLFSFADFLRDERVPKEAIEALREEGSVAAEEARKTTYICENNYSIDAEFSGDQASIVTSAGESLELSITQAASGARYSSQDGKFVFWTKGPEATVYIDGNIAYSQCIEPKQ